MTETGTFGWVQEIYNRPARVTNVHGGTAEVRWQDNGTLGFVPIGDLGAINERRE